MMADSFLTLLAGQETVRAADAGVQRANVAGERSSVLWFVRNFGPERNSPAPSRNLLPLESSSSAPNRPLRKRKPC